ncbi:MAG: NAD-dependent epimerase/dehydratase family protein [Candidatus Helarchaeota archaeon]|nr:NAD-dependent epimerase/dehydratase family protein [Candidatus Helarchaeota archaeon]
MIVAVTGINSGLGRTLVPKLQRESTIERIIGIDISEYKENPEKVNFIRVDVRDAEGMERALKGADVLVHLAYIVMPKKIPQLKLIYDINVNGSKTVFQAAAKNSVKKIIHLSSQSVYGHVKECSKIVKEDAPRLGIKTTNFYYSHTKALVEEFLDQFEKEFPAASVIRLRPPIITGPHFLQNLGLLDFRNKKRATTAIPANQEGKLPIQLIHEEDLTDVILMAIMKDIRGAYNVGSNIIPDLEEFAKQEYGIKVRRLPQFLVKLGIKAGRIWKSLIWAQAILYNSLLNTEKVEQEFHWKPKYSTEDCIAGINRQ